MTRRFASFAMADHPNWGTVIQRIKQGAPDPLTVVDYRDEAERHPVVGEVLRTVGGAGKKGREIQQLFEDPPFGWPKDAVDASLLVLLKVGQVRGKLNGQPVQAEQLAQNQIGSTEFAAESMPVDMGTKLGLRSLATELGMSATAGRELSLPPQILQKLLEESARAGGDAPLPEPPSSDVLKSLQGLYGNELAQATFQARDELASLHREWTAIESAKQLRLELWGLAKRLAAHARGTEEGGGAQAHLDAIQENRSLLAQPDPVAPVVGQLADSLREEVAKATMLLNTRLGEARTALEQSAGWDNLGDGERARILTDAALDQVHAPAVGDTGALIDFLDVTSLTDLRDRTDAISHRLTRALRAVAQATAPKATVVRLKRATIADDADLERYLDSLRADIQSELGPDSPVIVE